MQAEAVDEAHAGAITKKDPGSTAGECGLAEVLRRVELRGIELRTFSLRTGAGP